jgi:DNA-binding beta-propeller fold protein YncE
MLALLYLGLAIYLGDQLCRRFLRFVSVAQRCGSAVLVGLLLSSWSTYLAAFVFGRTRRPLLWADLCFFAGSVGMIWFIHRRRRRGIRWEAQFIQPRVPGSAFWDWITLAGFLVLACWMMFATLDYKHGTLLIGNNEWSDFGPNTAIIQSFAVGHNFPTQYPHFSGETIRYHFLFYFQAGNLTFLGLNLARSLNLLSVITLVSMLALVMALGQSLFHSRTVGRLGALFFFFHGTLSFVSFLYSQPSVSAAFHSITGLKDFLSSGYPYRGELWGIWTQVVYLNQRHFASGVGILLLVLLFLIDRYRQQELAKLAGLSLAPIQPPDPDLPPGNVTEEASDALAQPVDAESSDLQVVPHETELGAPAHVDIVTPLGDRVAAAPAPSSHLGARIRDLVSRVVVIDKGFLFVGCLLGLLPFWNALVFTACFAILAGLFLLFPCRRQMVALGLTTALIALPQLVILHAGGAQTATHPFFRWGYIIDVPTLSNVVRYIGFSFGLKLGLMLVGLAFASWFNCRLFLTICVLFLMTFCLELSIEILANHKYLNLWLIIGNLFAAFGILRLWLINPGWLRFVTRPAALLVTTGILLGGLIDLFPIHNSYFIQMKYGGDPLVKWIRENTKPHDIFLSDRFVNHQILLAGRRIFYGWPSFSWSAGYDTTKRDNDYRQLFESTDPYAVFRLLKENRIAYVAIDDGVRRGEFIKRPNEELYSANFPKVWEDKGNQYYGLVIYKVPNPPPRELKQPDPARLQAQVMQIPPVTMFQGGKGIGRGQFDFPRGIAVDRSGNILVSDTNNGRIQKFTPAGVYLNLFGSLGRNPGEFKEPNGIAVDSKGNIYVADVGNHRVQKLTGDGRFIAQWKGPAPGFYGPRDIWITPDDFVYVVDQGRARVVKLDSNGTVLATWGSQGPGDDQFDEPTAVTVDSKRQRVYVADPHHRRIQVFDTNGKFVSKWTVTDWQTTGWSFQDLWFDQQTDKLYAISPTTDEILVFDPLGNKLAALKPKPPYKLEGASALALLKGKVYVLCAFADRVTTIDLPGE